MKSIRQPCEVVLKSVAVAGGQKQLLGHLHFEQARLASRGARPISTRNWPGGAICKDPPAGRCCTLLQQPLVKEAGLFLIGVQVVSYSG